MRSCGRFAGEVGRGPHGDLRHLAGHPRDLKPTFDIWWDPACEHLHLGAWLANAIPPWGMLACPVEAAVRDPSQTPYCVSSPDETVNHVLTEEWDHDLVLEGIRAG